MWFIIYRFTIFSGNDCRESLYFSVALGNMFLPFTHFIKNLCAFASLRYIPFFFCAFLVFGFPVQAADTELPDFLREKKYAGPLKFVEVDIKERTKHSATITWETTHPASGRIKYGDNPDLPGTQNFISANKTHTVQLSDLTEGTKYGFRVYAWDKSDRRIKSQLIFFETKGMPPPQFKKLKVAEKTREGGVIRWVTNTPTTAYFEAGYDTPFEFTTKHVMPNTHHEVKLTQFYPGKELYYRISIEDTRGRTKNSGLRKFRTRENNVAWEKPVRGTFDVPIYGIPKGQNGSGPYDKRIVDDRYTYQYGTANSGDPADTVQWFVVDLEQFYVPDTAVFIWRRYAYPKKYRILGSKSGVYWEILAGDLNAADGEKVRKGGIPSIKHVISLNGIEEDYQFIKVEIPKGAPYHVRYSSYNFVQLQEFKLFPKENR